MELENPLDFIPYLNDLLENDDEIVYLQNQDYRELTLDPNMTINNLPEGGWINKDSHLLTFLANYWEDEMIDEPDEPEYEDFFDDIEETYSNDIDDVF